MGLSEYKVFAGFAGFAVSDMDRARARAFYEGKLGLSEGQDQPDGGRAYACGAGT